jgi:uncharacterized protein YciI
MVSFERQAVYFVASFTTTFHSMDEVRAAAPEALARHLAQSKQLQANGDLLMAGAFLDNGEGPVTTMGVLRTREAAEAYAKADPFVQAGLVSDWTVRAWANILD